mmetsp:Transcript_48354/g.130318  ORF Transcript_48354/g.130318 Transcript_48354/m.130318 type:complete len:434 (+) Transcript_48354:1938-3239(+)
MPPRKGGVLLQGRVGEVPEEWRADGDRLRVLARQAALPSQDGLRQPEDGGTPQHDRQVHGRARRLLLHVRSGSGSSWYRDGPEEGHDRCRHREGGRGRRLDRGPEEVGPLQHGVVLRVSGSRLQIYGAAISARVDAQSCSYPLGSLRDLLRCWGCLGQGSETIYSRFAPLGRPRIQRGLLGQSSEAPALRGVFSRSAAPPPSVVLSFPPPSPRPPSVPSRVLPTRSHLSGCAPSEASFSASVRTTPVFPRLEWSEPLRCATCLQRAAELDGGRYCPLREGGPAPRFPPWGAGGGPGLPPRQERGRTAAFAGSAGALSWASRSLRSSALRGARSRSPRAPLFRGGPELDPCGWLVGGNISLPHVRGTPGHREVCAQGDLAARLALPHRPGALSAPGCAAGGGAGRGVPLWPTLCMLRPARTASRAATVRVSVHA